MQWINFIRDINEDLSLKRSYFPDEDLKRFGLSNLTLSTAQENSKAFHNFIRFQLKRYNTWQREAEKGFKDIPKRLRIPLETAADNFNWTARKIANNPYVIYEKKVKPSKTRVVSSALKKVI